MSLFRKCTILLAGLAASQVMAKTVTHTVASGISTVAADSLENRLSSGDTLWIRANDGMATLGTGINFETNDLTLILDADADRDGTGTLASGFTVKSTGTNTQVRVLMGKNSKVGGTVAPLYHKDNFPLVEISPYPRQNYPYMFNLANDAKLDVLFLLSSRSDMDQLASILADGNGPFVDESYLNSSDSQSYRYGYALGSDIDMGNTFTTTMSNTANPFRAVFDGLHHSLQNLSINSTQDSVGLFHSTKFAVIRNLDLSAVNIQGKDYVGAIAGAIDSLTSLSNIRIQSGTISGNNYIAGITGTSWNSSSISRTINKASINGTMNASGIVDVNFGTLEHLENWGEVTSSSGNAAGIVDSSFSTLGIHNTLNFGIITGTYAAGILGYSQNDGLINAYNYATITGSQRAAGIFFIASAESIYLLNTGTISSSAGDAGGIAAGANLGVASVKFAANSGTVSGYQGAGTLYMGAGGTSHVLNTGSITATTGTAYGNCVTSFSTEFTLVSASINGPNTEAVCGPYKAYGPQGSAYNSDLAPSVGNTNNAAIKLDFSTLYNFDNYPEPESFKAFWHAPTDYTLPTPKDLLPNARIYKKLRQDVLVRATTDAFSMDSIRTYLPTYGNDWTYSCKARNGLATCAVAAKATTITQAYNVTGAETIVFEAAHASGLVVRDSLQVQYNVERKSAPGLSAAWPAATVVTEGTPVLLDLGQYFTDADGESITYTLSKTKVVYSELNGDILTLCYNKKVGTEALTVYATDAGGRVSPVASLAIKVSTLPGVLKALPVLVLKTDSVLTLDLDDYFWDADGDVLGYTVTEPKNNDAVLKGSILQIAMTSLRPDSLVVTVADDDKHVLRAGLKLVNSASPVLAVHPEQRLGLELAGDLLRITSAEPATAWLRILDLQGGLRYETTLDLATGTNALALPALPPGAYRIHVRQGGSLRTLGWEKR